MLILEPAYLVNYASLFSELCDPFGTAKILTNDSHGENNENKNRNWDEQ